MDGDGKKPLNATQIRTIENYWGILKMKAYKGNWMAQTRGHLIRQIKMKQLGMARGIPRPSILEVPELFSLLDSPRNRFYHSSAPRVLAKICRGPRKY